MSLSFILLTILLLFPINNVQSESFRTEIERNIYLSLDQPARSSVPIVLNSSAVVYLGEETRFFKGVEIEIKAKQEWLKYRNSLAITVLSNLSVKNISGVPESLSSARGIYDIEGTRLAFEPLPGKLQIIYQVPIRSSHGLRTTSYITVTPNIIPINSFPILIGLIPLSKGINEELETMVFDLTIRPILTDEGAVRLLPKYPSNLQGKAFSVRIDDVPINNLSEQIMLKEGEHHLVILSDDYRNESRRFMVEKAKILDLTIELQDPSPFIIFEGPQNARIFLNNTPVLNNSVPILVEPGQHEAKFQIGDYTIIKILNIQRGKTYRVALDIDLSVQEID